MIGEHDRSGWFGASDTRYVMGNWKTKTFQNWWMVKLGIRVNEVMTRAMNAGTYYEHPILDAIGAPRKDHQILITEYRLRVNLDGDEPGKIYEVKTHSADKPYRMSKAHYQQVQVECFAKLYEEGVVPDAEIVSYGLLPENYRNFFLPIDVEHIIRHPVAFNWKFAHEYLERLSYLKDCLEKGVMP